MSNDVEQLHQCLTCLTSNHSPAIAEIRDELDAAIATFKSVLDPSLLDQFDNIETLFTMETALLVNAAAGLQQ